jgi:hypothetical protein
VDLILDSERENPLFRAPCGDDKEAPLHVLDIGTGMGTWVMYADSESETTCFTSKYLENSQLTIS